ncbi:phosphonate C-P lyase system protein PhnH [Shimia marina]|uniref:Alpha-D-ribose 1-methylphosphonate 5-triphosphate synthase subunit PhnH n=1 Tax=Shimia marina TaxID=321267 RepID=A0A0P1FC10_9RHOB|nr:phosphonate C-P lyase system protein PhnH [Shimia marina]CUH50979.1 Alpha-D-ribose 1-methylphosphonate 5-triphosphate synthase subunit PhnH [Shimia marina]SFD61153.1 alpha-D-ribose 1-methylphosphonate 5-triphosphate synthase subunit PhnH [Shimia marina]
MDADVLKGGFANAPVDAARAFRGLMTVMARPGKLETLQGAQPPAPVSVAAGTVILTLCDPDTPLHLAGDWDCTAMRDWVAFHVGAPIVAAEQAMFAIGRWEDLAPLSRFAIGTPEYPDRSATLIVEREVLASAGATLRGPGIKETAEMALPETEAFQMNALLFPLGLDFFFTCGDQVSALPRTTKVEAA